MNGPTSVGDLVSAIAPQSQPPEPEAPRPSKALTEAVGGLFLSLELSHPSQYRMAFPTREKEAAARRLWRSALAERGADPACVEAAGKILCSESRYFPSLPDLMEAVTRANLARAEAPSAREAYREAANAPSPKAAQRWSHPAVYHAGARLGWWRLETEAEKVTWPEFEKIYHEVAAQGLQPALPPPDPARPATAKPAHALGARTCAALSDLLRGPSYEALRAEGDAAVADEQLVYSPRDESLETADPANPTNH